MHLALINRRRSGQNEKSFAFVVSRSTVALQ
jgi:hypothetical protein